VDDVLALALLELAVRLELGVRDDVVGFYRHLRAVFLKVDR
jgi:hypothetical protein